MKVWVIRGKLNETSSEKQPIELPKPVLGPVDNKVASPRIDRTSPSISFNYIVAQQIGDYT